MFVPAKYFIVFNFGLMLFISNTVSTACANLKVPQQSGRATMNQANDNDERAQQSDSAQEPVGYANWATKTLGGQQFWTDLRYVGGWRIQANSETGHCRLLDPKNVRRGWGNLAHCNVLLDRFVVEGKAKLCSGKVVIVLHGLIRTSKSMAPMATFLNEKGKYTTVNFQYASTRKSVGDHAVALKSLIDNLGPDVTEINFVGHSLGNIVVRRYLGDTTDPVTGRQGDPRVKRIVMIGPPNQGSRMARLLKSSLLFNTIAGVSGSDLSRGWEKLKPTLATPKMEFGIIAGGQKTDKNWSNFVLKGKDDFTVSLEEAKLVGASDLMVKPLLHSTMMHQPVVLEGALSFFQNGYFESADLKTAITNEQAAPSTKATQREPKPNDSNVGSGR